MNNTTHLQGGGERSPVRGVEDALGDRERLREAVLGGRVTIWEAARRLAERFPAQRISALRIARTVTCHQRAADTAARAGRRGLEEV